MKLNLKKVGGYQLKEDEMGNVYMTNGRKNEKPLPTLSNEMKKRIDAVGALYLKKNNDELQEYLHFKRRGTVIDGCKGKAPYRRKQKHTDKGLTSD